MVSAGDFRNGVTFEMDGGVYQIIEFQHVKPGKGAAIVKAKLKNLRTGSIAEYTFNAGILNKIKFKINLTTHPAPNANAGTITFPNPCNAPLIV